MKIKIENSDYILSPISKERYKIELKLGKFTKEHAKNINGCYWSKTQQSWVMPQTKESVQQIENLFTISTPKNNKAEKSGNHSNNINKTSPPKAAVPKEYIDTLQLKGYSNATIKSYKIHLSKFLTYYKNIQPNKISDEQVREYLLHLINDNNLSVSYQNMVINSIMKRC